MTDKKKRTKGIERAFQILDCMVEIGKPATAYAIAQKIQAPLSTVYGLIANLEELGLVGQSDGAYRLGDKLLSFGLAYLKGLDEYDLLHKYLHHLAEVSGYDVLINIRDNDLVVVASKTDNHQELGVSVRRGTRVPFNWTASGLFLAGTLQGNEREQLWMRAVPSPSGKAPIDPGYLEELYGIYWEQGYGIQRAETLFDVSFIAAPILDGMDECHSTFSLLVPKQVAEVDGESLGKLLKDTMRKMHVEVKEFSRIDPTINRVTRNPQGHHLVPRIPTK